MGALPRKHIEYLLIILIIAGSLLNTNWFGSPSLTAFFLFIIISSAFSFRIIIKFLRNKKTTASINSIPIIIFFAFSVYYLLLEISTKNSGTNFFLLYLFAAGLLLFTIGLFFKNYIEGIKIVFRIILFFAIAESIFCLLQYCKITQSKNNLFAVTGTWVNPNVTAMFLALAMPAILHRLIFQTTSKFVNWVFFGITMIALLLLRCRTALIGTAFSVLIMLNYKYKLLFVLRYQYTLIKKIVLSVLFVGILFCLSLFLYFSKQSSTDGRKFIWKISSEMILKHPVTGYGLGMFERYYNLEQAEYFAAGKGNEREKQNAGFVLMAYNEFLQNTVEGGLIALLFFVAFLISLLIPLNKNTGSTNENNFASYHIAAHSAIIGFIIMSLFNFTVQAIPVMSLFIIYASFICTARPFSFFQAGLFTKYRQVLSIVSLMVVLFIGVSAISYASDFRKVMQASYLSNQRENDNAIHLLETLNHKLAKSENYWNNYAKILIRQRQYNLALQKLESDLLLTSNPDIYMACGICYEEIQKPDSAFKAYTIAHEIEPKRLKPIFSLMNFYLRQHDKVSAVKMANEILSIEPKVLSAEAKFYKEQAKKLII